MISLSSLLSTGAALWMLHRTHPAQYQGPIAWLQHFFQPSEESSYPFSHVIRRGLRVASRWTPAPPLKDPFSDA